MTKKCIDFGLNPSFEDLTSILSHNAMTFKSLSPSLKRFLDSVDRSFFEGQESPPYPTLAVFKKEFLDALGRKAVFDENNLSKPAQFLASMISRLYVPDVITEMLDTVIIKPTDQLNLMHQSVCNLMLATTLLFRDLKGSEKFLNWVSRLIVPRNWHQFPTVKNSVLRYMGVASLKGGMLRKPAWLLIDQESKLHIIEKNHNFDDMTIFDPHIEKIAGSHVSIKGRGDDETVKVVFASATEAEKFASELVNPSPFPTLLGCSTGKSYPSPVIDAFYECLTSNDTYVLRALLNSDVLPLTKKFPLKEVMAHLMTIFAYEGHTQRLLTTCAAVEFGNEGLTTDKILRQNSHLTTLFKHYQDAYGKYYFDNVIRDIVVAVESEGDIGIGSGKKLNVEKFQKLLFSSLETIIHSGKFVLPQVRHMAHVLKMTLLTRFSDRKTIFNLLSGFFFLRFTTAMLFDPISYDPSLEGQIKNQGQDTLVPFCQQLQVMLNLQLIPRDEKFAFDDDYERKGMQMLVSIYQFIHNLGDMEGCDIQNLYKKPTEMELTASLQAVLDVLTDQTRRANFVRHYEELMRDENDVSPATWRITEFIVNCFDE